MSLPPCAGRWDIFDSVNPADHAEAKAICGTCVTRDCRPVLAEIFATWERQQVTGTWDGRLYSEGSIRRVAAPATCELPGCDLPPRRSPSNRPTRYCSEKHGRANYWRKKTERERAA